MLAPRILPGRQRCVPRRRRRRRARCVPGVRAAVAVAQPVLKRGCVPLWLRRWSTQRVFFEPLWSALMAGELVSVFG